MTATVYMAFAVGVAIGLEFGFRWGQSYMFNKIVRAVTREIDYGEILERKKDEPHQAPKDKTD